jgi:hypothetical protein
MGVVLAYERQYAFNAICPYYTMFPIEYPLGILRKHAKDDPIILDPFCGRGTTIYAARKLGFESYGIDASPIAASIARAKLSAASVEKVLELCTALIAVPAKDVPEGEFFAKAFSPRTLAEVCSLREGLLASTDIDPATEILRAAALGCLHGPLPRNKGTASYFSNQMPRTFASKPDYSVRYWEERDLVAPDVSVVDVLRKKLERISDLDTEAPVGPENIRCLDSRFAASFKGMKRSSVTITSPPYYGMRTYLQDQWLRLWFVGGDEEIDYENDEQLSHTGHEAFIADLAKVWRNVRRYTNDGGHLYVRFGTLPSAKSDAKSILKNSLAKAGGWKLLSVRSARTANAGKRQADQMGRASDAADEFDFHAVKV